jgi:hypothetical protein
MRLSHTFPLDIIIRGCDYLFPLHPDSIPIFETASRWRSATIQLTDDFPSYTLPDMPHLEQLTIQLVDYGTLAPFVIDNAPRLHSLTLIHLVPLSSIQIPFASLTKLYLQSISFSQSLRILAQTPMLEFCHIETLLQTDHLLEPIPLSLPNLTHLSIGSENPGIVIQVLGKPCLEYLELRQTTSDIHLLIPFLHSCTTLRHIHLHGPVVPVEHVRSFFDSVPRLVRLRWDSISGELSSSDGCERPAAIVAALISPISLTRVRLPQLRLFETNSVWDIDHIKALTQSKFTTDHGALQIYYRRYTSRFIDESCSDISGLEEEFRSGVVSVIVSLGVRDD